MGACGGCRAAGAPKNVQKAGSHQEEGLSETVWLSSVCVCNQIDAAGHTGKLRFGFGWETSQISTKFRSSFKILFFLY